MIILRRGLTNSIYGLLLDVENCQPWDFPVIMLEFDGLVTGLDERLLNLNSYGFFRLLLSVTLFTPAIIKNSTINYRSTLNWCRQVAAFPTAQSFVL